MGAQRAPANGPRDAQKPRERSPSVPDGAPARESRRVRRSSSPSVDSTRGGTDPGTGDGAGWTSLEPSSPGVCGCYFPTHTVLHENVCSITSCLLRVVCLPVGKSEMSCWHLLGLAGVGYQNLDSCLKPRTQSTSSCIPYYVTKRLLHYTHSPAAQLSLVDINITKESDGGT